METISHLNLSVSGFPFTKITHMSISHECNCHGKAVIIGELDHATAEECVQRTDEHTFVTISTSADGQPEKLFCGYVETVSVQNQAQYSSVQLSILSASCKTDIVKHKKSFQNTSKTYGDILTQAANNTADIHMMVSDKAIGSLVVQYNETEWEFALRMASQLAAPLTTDIVAPKAQIYVGLPPARRTHDVNTNFVESAVDNNFHAFIDLNYGKAMHEDFLNQEIKSYEYGFLGDIVTLNGAPKTIKGITAQLVDGILTMTFSVLSGNAGKAAGGSISSLAIPPLPSNQTAGKMMRGTVKKVLRDKVQVHLIDIDPEYDGGGTWWFPYSTAYSSTDTSGWYCMPEEEDTVRVFFPSGNTGDAFAASSVCVDPPDVPRHKRWKAPGGKQILLTDEGIYIICEEGKIYINLLQDSGIEIQGDKGVNIVSATSVSIQAQSEIEIAAENQIVVGTPNAYLMITKDAATLTAPTVNID